jgi:hypothetical protein
MLQVSRLPFSREGIHSQITDSLIALNNLEFLASMKVGEFKRRQAALMTRWPRTSR